MQRFAKLSVVGLAVLASGCSSLHTTTQGLVAGGLLGAGTGALIGNAATAPPQPSGRCAQFGYDYNGNRVCTAFY